MRKGRYVLALIPLGAIWVYAISQSAGQFFAAVETVRVNVPAARSTESSIDRSELGERLAAAGNEAKLSQPPAVEPEVDAEYLENELAVREHYPETPGDDATHADEHPEITDPKIRRLLQPAWDD